ncbi:response regulator transcription factor [Actinoplanes sp. NPDC051633]|uniref:response regulator transcription factor n=1 Tax=Actinoplanes sp. NPDC051633 TaxID=3155670 RepID=UPI0034294754
MRIAVADDSLLTREGVVHLLTGRGHEVVGQAGTADALLSIVEAAHPEAVVVDIRMPPTHTDEGLVAARRIRAAHPEIGVLVLSQYVEPAYAMRLIEESPEGVGYLLKDRIFDGAVLDDALRRIADGETVVDPTIVSRLLRRRRTADPLDDLSERSTEVLGLVAEGLSNLAIGARLHITERTVESHITKAFQHLGLTDDPGSHRRVLAVLAYLRRPPSGPSPDDGSGAGAAWRKPR